jgi:transposase
MVFREIGDELQEIIRHYLPPTKPQIGRPRRDPRGPRRSEDFRNKKTIKCSPMFNGIVHVLITGCSWADVPAKYGIMSTVHHNLLELCEKASHQISLSKEGIRRGCPPLDRGVMG